MPPAPRPNVITARLLRPVDLLDLWVSVRKGTLRSTREGPVLEAGNGCLLFVDLAFQHLGEQAFPEPGPSPSGLAVHRAARASRLVYDVPSGTAISWTTAGLLEAIPRLRLRVVPLAVPAGAEDVPVDLGLIGPIIDSVVLGRAAREDVAGRPIGAAVRAAAGIRLGRGLARRVAEPFEPGEIPKFRRPSSRTKPRAPKADETALEVPYRLVVSPSALGAFVHEVEPLTAVGDDGRVELWRTTLTTRVLDADGEFAGHTDKDDQRIVRAVWARDLEPPDAPDDDDVALMSMDPIDRRSLVRQSASVHEGVRPSPFHVNRLRLTSLGARVDWRAVWEPLDWPAPQGWRGSIKTLSSYRHIAFQGRDSYVRLAYPGFLYPFGHRAELIKVTERKIDDATRTAFLRQRYFIVLKDTVRQWAQRDTPFTQVVLEPPVTPDLEPPGNEPTHVFVPRTADGEPFLWDILGTDRAGEPVTLSEALVFVPDDAILQNPGGVVDDVNQAYAPHQETKARGQQVSFATPAAPGDTRLEVRSLTWTGEIDFTARTSRPSLVGTNAVVPALSHLAPLSPAVDLEFVQAYVDDPDDPNDPQFGFGATNPGGLFLKLAAGQVPLDFTTGTDKAGGFVAPNFNVRALSRSLGAVGDDGTLPTGLAGGNFDPAEFLKGALPKLFGLFDLVELIEAVAGPIDLGDAPEFVTEALDTVGTIVSAVQRLQAAIKEAQDRFDADLAQAVAKGAHDGAQQAIIDAKAALTAVVAPIEAELEKVADAFETLVDDPTQVAAIKTALTALAALLASLRTALAHPRIPAVVRSTLSKPLSALESLLSKAEDLAVALEAVEQFVNSVLTPADGITARFDWRPPIGSWPAAPDKPVFIAEDERGFGLSVEVRASASKTPVVDVSAELRTFALELLPGEPLMRMDFSRIGFHVGSGSKPEVDVVFDGMGFLGALGFIETLRRMIPFDGFADPPYVDVAADGVTAGFDLELPNVAVGVFSLENISLGADARVPFLGDAVTAGFAFCSKDSPFRLTVMCIGGGGWVGIRLSPKGLVELEMGLEAAAALSVDFGVASGSVSIAVGVYLRLEGEEGSLTGYFRVRGEVDVLGLISASITLELALSYDFPTGKMIGRASIVVEVEVLFFSASVEISCERRLAGSKGDPVLKDIMPPDSATGDNADWSSYCAAFAPGA